MIGVHTTDDQDTTQLPVPVNQKETADVMVFDVSNYYIDNMVKNNVEHVTETEVQAINNLTNGSIIQPPLDRNEERTDYGIKFLCCPYKSGKL